METLGLPAEISDTLLQLNEDQLRQLHNIVAERLRLFHSAKHLRAMADFNLGDTVCFDYHGQKITGTITRLNQKTVSLISEERKQWKVSPQLLRRISTAHRH